MADDTLSTQTRQMLDRLDTFIGHWHSEVGDPQARLQVQTTFEWLTGRTFLIQRWEIPQSPYPSGIAIIGYDEAAGNFTQHYFDSRGVARIYQMSLSDGLWALWRDDPDFSQRFTGRFSADGNTIRGAWEVSRNGAHWEHDFDLTFRRAA
jgi:hypothetical protein